MDPREAGAEAAKEVRKETLEACQRRRVTPDYVIRRLKKLSKFKGRKPFTLKDSIIYSEPLDFPDVQLRASSELADLLDMRPSKRAEITGANGKALVIEIVKFGHEAEEKK